LSSFDVLMIMSQRQATSGPTMVPALAENGLASRLLANHEGQIIGEMPQDIVRQRAKKRRRIQFNSPRMDLSGNQRACMIRNSLLF
jgi:hypothetical protein